MHVPTFLYAISKSLREACCRVVAACLMFSPVSESLLARRSLTFEISSFSLVHYESSDHRGNINVY